MTNFNTCCFTGHRPKDLFGYDWNNYTGLIKVVGRCVDKLVKEYGTTRFISGGAQGADQMSYWIVEKYRSINNVENWVYVPCQSQPNPWKDTGPFSKDEYNKMVARAQANGWYRLISEDGYSSKLMHERNIAMLNDSDVVIGVYKGDIELIRNPDIQAFGGTIHCLRNAYAMGKPIIIVNPVTLQTSTLNFTANNQEQDHAVACAT